ncbi:unnamed protein product, partial [Nesidiocoris tenuis]
MSTNDSFQSWLGEFKDKLDAEKRSIEDESQSRSTADLDRVRGLATELNSKKPNMEDLSDKCETLMELCACNWVRDETVKAQGVYAEFFTIVQELKNIDNDLKGRSDEIQRLKEEAGELVKWANSPEASNKVEALENKWIHITSLCGSQKESLEAEIKDHNAYHQSLHDIEKWLLQVSFQLMAHNSLYITNKEQTQEQMDLHNTLLADILGYQATIDDLRAKGICQIERYSSSNSQIKPTIEQQLANVQDSYDSLLHTALQIKSRLEESLQKFLEYERTLDSIMANLDAYEVQLGSDFTASPEVDIVKEQLDLHRVEDRLGQLLKASNDLEEKEKQLQQIDSWAADQMAALNEWKNKPWKLRPDLAKSELAAMAALHNDINDNRTRMLTDLPQGSHADAVKSRLDDLELLLKETLEKKIEDENQVEAYRAACAAAQQKLEGFAKQLELVDKGHAMDLPKRIAKLDEIAKQCDAETPTVLANIKKLAEKAANIVSNIDAQQIDEQIKGFDKKFNDLGKKISRKKDVLKSTNEELEGINDTLGQAKDWAKSKLDYVRNPPPMGYDVKASDERVQALKLSAMNSTNFPRKRPIATINSKVCSITEKISKPELTRLGSGSMKLKWLYLYKKLNEECNQVKGDIDTLKGSVRNMNLTGPDRLTADDLVNGLDQRQQKIARDIASKLDALGKALEEQRQ